MPGGEIHHSQFFCRFCRRMAKEIRLLGYTLNSFVDSADFHALKLYGVDFSQFFCRFCSGDTHNPFKVIIEPLNSFVDSALRTQKQKVEVVQ